MTVQWKARPDPRTAWDYQLGRSELAALFGVSLPTIDNWRRAGCPARKGPGTFRYPLADVLRWVMARKEAEAGQARASVDELKRRKLEAETHQAELEPLRANDEAVEIVAAVAILQDILAAVRARLMQVPGKWASRLVGVSSRSIEIPTPEVVVNPSSLGNSRSGIEGSCVTRTESPRKDPREGLMPSGGAGHFRG